MDLISESVFPLSSREISVLIWAAIGLGWSLLSGTIRPAVFEVVERLLVPRLEFLLVLFFAYVLSLVWFLYYLNVWTVSHLKPTMAWSFTSGLVSVLRISLINVESVRTHLARTVIDQLRILPLIAYLFGLTTFHFAIELLLQPLLLFFVLLLVYAERHSEFRVAALTLHWVLVGVGLVLISATLWNFVASSNEFSMLGMVEDLSVPVFLSLFAVPFLLLIYAYATYEYEFSAIHHVLPDMSLRWHAVSRAVLYIRFDFVTVKKFVREIRKERPKSKRAINEMVRRINNDRS